LKIKGGERIKRLINRGFTLIELLIVMAILGVLAVVVLVAMNPVQQLARTRDTGRKSSVTQVGRALEAYYTSHGGRYLTVANCGTGGVLREDWMSCLRESGELSIPVANITYNTTLATACISQSVASIVHVSHNGFCYAAGASGSPAIVYARLESASDRSKCTVAGNTIPYFVWSTLQGRGGLFCGPDIGGVPAPGTITFTD